MAEQNQILEYPKGVKWTKQRKCVYQVLSEAAEPLSAQQIYMQVEGMVPNDTYALSTIYRILAVFEEKDLVNSTTWMGDDTVVYELNRGGHTHYAVCLGCHKRIPLHSCPFAVGHFGHRHSEQGEEELTDFTVIGHKVELYGYCSECSKNRVEGGT
jgi:Fur family ferric uptake transcriptional regulator